MKPSEIIRSVEKLRIKTQSTLRPLEERLSSHLGKDVYIVHQPSDGWCVLFNDDKISPLCFLSIERLLGETQEEALTLLHLNSV